jgi:glutaredoxin
MVTNPRPHGRLAEHPNTIEEAIMASASHPQVIIYTTPTCPDCWALKAWLEREGIAFEERDLLDPEIMEEAKARTGVRIAPITLAGEKVFYGTFPSQKQGLTAALGLSNTAPGSAL